MLAAFINLAEGQAASLYQNERTIHTGVFRKL